jgi:signal transduction histidine kinase
MLRKLVALRDTLTIRARLNLMAAVPVALVLLVGGLSLFATFLIGVNGPVYDRVLATKDLSVDISPSSETLTAYAGEVRTFATTGISGQLSEAEFNAEVAKLNAIEAKFKARHAYWDQNLTDAATRKALLVDAYQPALEYFKYLHDQLVPAIYKSDDDAIAAFLNGPMQDQYVAHIKAINDVQALASKSEQREESSATRTAVIQVVVTVFFFLAALVMIVLLALGISRSINDRIFRLQQVAKEDLPRLLKEVRRATAAGEPVPPAEPVVFATRDELSDAADAFNDVVGTAVELAGQQALLQRATAEMFVNLGRRNHKLLSRTLSYITELERDERNPATLKSLFRLDHLTTRMRRHAESLLVLAGSTPLRTWSRPVAIGDVVRAALSEIEAYERVDVEPLTGAAIKGGAVSDIAHLLAELLENSATFSPPDSRVRVTGRPVGEGYALIIIDEGIGMTADELAGANRRLAAGSSDLDGSKMLGLAVVGRLAARHDVHVELMDSPTGGLVTRVMMPTSLLESTAPVTENTLDTAQVPAAVGAEAGLPSLGRSAGGADSAAGDGRPVSGGNGHGGDAPKQAEPTPAAKAEQPEQPKAEEPKAEPEVKAEAKTEVEAEESQVEADEAKGDRANGFREPAGIERGTRPAGNGKPAAARVPSQTPRRPEAVPAVPAAPVPAASTEAAATAKPAPPKPEGASVEQPKPEVHGLRRRVRGAQLPDTGPEASTEPAPERTAEGVRSALASFAAGRKNAAKKSD